MKIPTLDQLYLIKEKVFTKLKINLLPDLLVNLGFSPNKLTLISIFCGLLACVFLFHNHLVFVFFYLSNRGLDMLDGYVARKLNKETKLGNKLDHWGDLFVHSLLLIKAAAQINLTFWAGLALFAYLSEYLYLKKNNLINRKFPTSAFGIFYLFGLFKIGLIFQIIYQFTSLIYFTKYLNPSYQQKK